MRGSKTYWRRVLLSTGLVTLWSLFPSCSGGQDHGDFLKTEIDNIENLTIPNGSSPGYDPAKPIIRRYGATAAWEFDTAMSSAAYFRWVSSRLQPVFGLHSHAEERFVFSRYLKGDEETIDIATSPQSGSEHVRVTLDLYAD